MPDLPLPAPTPPSQPAQTAGAPPSAVKPVVSSPPVGAASSTAAPIAPPPSTLQTTKSAFTPPPGGGLVRPGSPVAPAPSTAPATSVAAPVAPSSTPGVIRPGISGQARPGGPAGMQPGGPVPAGATAPGAKPNTQMAVVRQSPLRFLPFIIGGLVVIGLVVFAVSTLFRGLSPQPAGPSTSTNTGSNNANNNTNGGGRSTVPAAKTKITYWGLWEPTPVMDSVIKDFETANPEIDVEFVPQSHKDYRERLQTAVASGQGPDVYRYHASWVPMIKNELSALPNNVMTPSEYGQAFYPVAVKQLTSGGQIVGVPSYYDGLALYYNKEILRNAGAEPPTTWAQLRTLATQLTVRTQTGQIQRAGLAIGNATNVEHFSDIIGLLMLQNGADPADPTSQAAIDAMTFYTNFTKVDKVWDDTLPSSTIAFARGDAAMMLAPSWRAHEVKNTNPNLDFAIAPLPKLGQNAVTWASYWAEGVSAKSSKKDAAWTFVKYLTSAETEQKLYSAQSQVRTFGTPYARVSLASQLANDPYVGAYLTDAPLAQDWYLNSFTHDNGLNDQLIKYYRDAVTAIVGGRDVADTMKTVDLGTKQVLRQYNVSATSQSGTSTAPAGGGASAFQR